jgi:peptide/nickel transport system ATP-binding protein
MPLEGRSLGYRYHKQSWIFQQVDIHVEPGEIVGLVGPSGCGKSTLGKLLAGHLKPHQGQVRVNGDTIAPGQLNPVQLVLQHPEQAVNPRWKARYILEESGQLDESMLSELAIEQKWLSRYPNELSGGRAATNLCSQSAEDRDPLFDCGRNDYHVRRNYAGADMAYRAEVGRTK